MKTQTFNKLGELTLAQLENYKNKSRKRLKEVQKEVPQGKTYFGVLDGKRIMITTRNLAAFCEKRGVDVTNFRGV